MEDKVTNSDSNETTPQDSRRSTNGQSGSQAQGSAVHTEERSYQASIYPGEKATIPNSLAKKVRHLEQAFSELSEKDGMETDVWLLIQAENEGDKERAGAYIDINEEVRRAFFSERDKLSKDKQIVLVIDSSGGSAKSAYQLATFFRHYGGRFVALVPRSAKSAATLLTLGADEIVLGNYGELGPVDAQVRDREGYIPALDRVKTLERLHASALEAVDRTMALLTLRTREDIDKLLPRALEFAASLSQPYLQEQDMVDYTRMSRVLKIGEDYASRLLELQYHNPLARSSFSDKGTRQHSQSNLRNANSGEEDIPYEEELSGDYSRPSKRWSRLLAQHLAGAYPDHGFAIDEEEAKRIGLQVNRPPKHVLLIIDELVDELNQAIADRSQVGLAAVGRVVESEDG